MNALKHYELVNETLTMEPEEYMDGIQNGENDMESAYDFVSTFVANGIYDRRLNNNRANYVRDILRATSKSEGYDFNKTTLKTISLLLTFNPEYFDMVSNVDDLSLARTFGATENQVRCQRVLSEAKKVQTR